MPGSSKYYDCERHRYRSPSPAKYRHRSSHSHRQAGNYTPTRRSPYRRSPRRSPIFYYSPCSRRGRSPSSGEASWTKKTIVQLQQQIEDMKQTKWNNNKKWQQNNGRQNQNRNNSTQQQDQNGEKKNEATKQDLPPIGKTNIMMLKQEAQMALAIELFPLGYTEIRNRLMDIIKGSEEPSGEKEDKRSNGEENGEKQDKQTNGEQNGEKQDKRRSNRSSDAASKKK